MASSASIPATSASPAAKAASVPSSQRRLPQSSITLRPSVRRTNFAFSAASPAAQGSYQHQSVVVSAKLNEVSVVGSTAPSKSENPKPTEEDEPAKRDLLSDSSISEFMTEVASLMKLVDSRDIVELQLKQLDCELVIRKKEALPQPSTAAPMVMAQPPAPQAVAPSQLPSAPAVVPAAALTTPRPASTPPTIPTRSSHPPLKCPMAGTFYRSPAPGEPPFVKIGDKVKKGQVLCIIEAMKLMNEIEADQSGTVVDILADDGKAVSADTPLFVIEP